MNNFFFYPLLLIYSILSVGAAKMFLFFADEASLIIGVSRTLITQGVGIGSLGAAFGKFFFGIICKNKEKYLLFFSFFFAGITFFLTFKNFVPVNYMWIYFLILRFLQGLSCGAAYGVIISTIANYTSYHNHKHLIKFLLSSVGISGSIFIFLSIFFSYNSLNSIFLIIPFIGALYSLFLPIEKKQYVTKEVSFFKNFLNSITLSNILFSLSWSFALSGVMMFINHSKRLLHWNKDFLDFFSFFSYLGLDNKGIINFIAGSPFLFGGLPAFFFKKDKKDSKTFLFFSFLSFCFLLYSIFCHNFIIFSLGAIFLYSFQLFLAPTLNTIVVESSHEYNRDIVSSNFHAFRSIMSSLINTFILPFVMRWEGDFFLLSLSMILCLVISLIFYFIGKRLSNIKDI